MKRKVPFGLILTGLVSSVIGLLFIFNFTNPSEAGSFGILGLFGCIYLFSVSLLLTLQHIYDAVCRKKRDSNSDVNRVKMLYLRTNLIIIALSFIPIFIISMNSIGQLSVIDVALMIVIETIVIFYIFRRTAD